MSINQNKIFYGNGAYNPPWYDGYDQNWILGRRAPPYSHPADGSEETPKGVIVLKMPLGSDACVEKVKTKLIDMEGVTSVECSTEEQKVTVRGDANPKDVLAKAKKISSRTDFWKDEKKK